MCNFIALHMLTLWDNLLNAHDRRSGDPAAVFGLIRRGYILEAILTHLEQMPGKRFQARNSSPSLLPLPWRNEVPATQPSPTETH